MRILSIAFISSITTAISFGAKFFDFGGAEKVEHVVVVDTKFFDVDGVEKADEHVTVKCGDVVVKCGKMEGSSDWCANSMRLTVGTEIIDCNPTAPIISDHGLNIYKVTDEGLDVVSVSGDEFESEGCITFPWSATPERL